MGDGNLVSQYIDSMGKSRSYTIQYPGGQSISYITLPSIPGNVSHTEEFALPDISFVAKILGNSAKPYSLDMGEGIVKGVWYQLFEIMEGIYVPVKSTNIVPEGYTNLIKGSPNPLKGTKGDNNTIRLSSLERTLNVLFDIMEWVYELERIVTPNITGLIFSDNYLILDNYTDDSLNYYKYDNLPRSLPEVNSPGEAMDYLSQTVLFIHNRRFRMYSKEFASKVIKKMEEYGERTIGEKPLVYNNINSYYSTSRDFGIDRNEIVFKGSSVLEEWIRSRVFEKENIFELRKTLNMGIAVPFYPILYSDENDRIWIIQNTIDASKESSLAVGINWANDKFNSGARTKPIDKERTPPHYIFIIAISGKLVVKEDHTGNYLSFVNIIKYSDEDRKSVV